MEHLATSCTKCHPRLVLVNSTVIKKAVSYSQSCCFTPYSADIQCNCTLACGEKCWLNDTIHISVDFIETGVSIKSIMIKQRSMSHPSPAFHPPFYFKVYKRRTLSFSCHPESLCHVTSDRFKTFSSVSVSE